MFKKILLGFVLLVVVGVAVLAVVVAMQPDNFRIERTGTIAAPVDVVFEQVNDLHKWDAWSPWAKLDPNAKNTFVGAESGEGAVFQWAGNDEVGEGKMTIVESKPNELVNIRLDFIKPFESTGNSEFAFEPVGEKTSVTWAMYGKHTFLEKGMCLLMNMEKVMGESFETGFANMNKVIEAQSQAKPSEVPAGVVELKQPATPDPVATQPKSE